MIKGVSDGLMVHVSVLHVFLEAAQGSGWCGWWRWRPRWLRSVVPAPDDGLLGITSARARARSAQTALGDRAAFSFLSRPSARTRAGARTCMRACAETRWLRTA